MDLIIFNRLESKTDSFKETIYVRMAMIYARKVVMSSFMSETLINWHYIDKVTYKEFCMFHDTLFPIGNDSRKLTTIEVLTNLKKFKSIKHKNKEILIHIKRVENFLDKVKENVIHYVNDLMKEHKLFPLSEYLEEMHNLTINSKNSDNIEKRGLMLDHHKEFKKNEFEEDKMIKDIIECITIDDINFVFDEVIEQLVPFSNAENAKEDSFFVSIPLFEFPILDDLTKDQLVKVMDDFLPLVKPFQEGYDDLKKELATMNFKPESMNDLLNKYICQHLQTIRTMIDENVYIQKQKNTYESSKIITVMLGISSIENQIRLYEKAELIMPFVADTILEKLDKNIDIKTCTPFIYNKVPFEFESNMIRRDFDEVETKPIC